MVHYLLAGITVALIWAWVVAHQLVLFYVLSVLIEQLPPPDSTSGKLYTYFYGVVQLFAANWKRTKDAIKPNTGA